MSRTLQSELSGLQADVDAERTLLKAQLAAIEAAKDQMAGQLAELESRAKAMEESKAESITALEAAKAEA
eukprot:1054724-Pyramimonas_sp.AAC.1